MNVFEEKQKYAAYIANLIQAYNYAIEKGQADTERHRMTLSNEIDSCLKELSRLIKKL